MLISGFTIVRDGIRFDYPFIESIRSALPVCDEFIVNVGISGDGTRQAIEKLKASLPPEQGRKISVFESEWPLSDPEKRKGGRILAEQTNLALQRCQGEWCLYLQADEVIHEEDHAVIRKDLERLAHSPGIEGLVFQYTHFYGTYDVIQTSRSSYRREIRIIRNHLGIESTGDAQSFRHSDGRKIAAALSKARIFHYGWVKPQEVMKNKTGFMDTLYHPGAKAESPATGNNYLFKRFVGLRRFSGSHPAVMQARIAGAPSFDFDAAPLVFEFKDIWKILSGWIESATGHRLFEYKNYRLSRAGKQESSRS